MSNIITKEKLEEFIELSHFMLIGLLEEAEKKERLLTSESIGHILGIYEDIYDLFLNPLEPKPIVVDDAIFKKYESLFHDIYYWDYKLRISPDQEQIKLGRQVKTLLCSEGKGFAKAFIEFIYDFCPEIEIIGTLEYVGGSKEWINVMQQCKPEIVLFTPFAGQAVLENAQVIQEAALGIKLTVIGHKSSEIYYSSLGANVIDYEKTFPDIIRLAFIENHT